MRPSPLTRLAASTALCAALAAGLCFAAPALAQDEAPRAMVAGHGDWTLMQREDWLHDRLRKARDDGSIDHDEFERVNSELRDIHDQEQALRDRHDGQLTDNETADLESRLDGVADKIHWLREASFSKPW